MYIQLFNLFQKKKKKKHTIEKNTNFNDKTCEEKLYITLRTHNLRLG